jgi:hypothetical protein
MELLHDGVGGVELKKLEWSRLKHTLSRAEWLRSNF